ncbi:MAG: 5'-3' exonuclease H3TH domain-containing protein [Cocleimonas sp.]
MNQPAWLIDSSIYVFKAWYTNSSEKIDINGNPINAVLGFIDFVYRLLSYEKPQRIAFAFDESLHTSHRKEIYPDYKANRSTAPDSLRKQFKMCRNFIQALGIHQDASLHYEADDLIGTWAKSLRQENIAVNIITADKDLAQLVHESDHWWEYSHGNRLDIKAITKKFRVKPSQIADQLAIAGDKSDNIPGVPRVGMATAAKLLKKFESIDNLLASIDEISSMQIRGAKLIQESIQEHQDTIRLSRKLTGIVCDIKTVDIDTFYISTFDEDVFSRIAIELNLTEKAQEQWLILINDLNLDS